MTARALSPILFTLLLLSVPSAPRAAGWANPDLLVTPDVVQANAGKADWVIVDCRELKDYAKGHIPGAISLGKPCKKALRDPTARAFKDPKKYESFLGKAGIGNQTHVVLYGEHKVTDTFKDVTVAFWVLEWLGHEKAHVLNGGIDAWIKAGKQLTNEPTVKAETTFKASVVARRYASTEEMVRIARGKQAGVTVIDARSRDEHAGKDIRALRGGYLPNTTVNIPHTETMEQDKDAATGKSKDNGYLSAERVAETYKGLDPARRTIAYCQTGTRSTLTYLELRLLGFKDPANYDDSWIVWANDLRYPVADEQWINFERLNEMEKRLKKLEEAGKPSELAAQ
jgi:thiosulfate/3-mercaptopyruvate sulfurtransferase